MSANPYDPGRLTSDVPEPAIRQKEILRGVLIRGGIAFAALGAFVATVFPRSEYVIDINPLAGPLNYLVWSDPQDVANGAFASALCLGAFVSLAAWPRWYTLLPALLAAIVWLAYARFFLILLCS